MIDSTDRDLMAWAEHVLPGVEVRIGPPTTTPPEDRAVGLYLLELRSHPPLRGSRPEPLRLWARYLVQAWAPSPSEAHAMLFQLVFSALEREDLDVDLDPPTPDLWLALGVRPAPCFRVAVPVRRVRPEPRVKPVLHPLVVRPDALGTLAGWVRTPDDQPLSGARVEIPALERSVVTDRDGRFRLTALPGRGTPIELRVRAKGREVWTSIATDADRDAVVIRLDPVGGNDGGIPHP
jgi:hypothetical protein